MANMKSCKILSCKEEIKEYLGNISDHMFTKYVRLGMPARYDHGAGWFAHTENLEKWWQAYTAISMKKLIMNMEEGNPREYSGNTPGIPEQAGTSRDRQESGGEKYGEKAER